ncbi:hypothetical protein FA15DRAFT_695085 [Coprinopsis marcescibilis]|uniref:Telomere-associated protein Rif1 N-terminal domain-containing protein n=1 Tax=Coprinopsis marcescibilis TaxID=230819 RepID=A0A5C3KS48_COPMA|nr:hypothetical protein FA15DRAFT_695085 [Coprinopsis marcescibilis]
MQQEDSDHTKDPTFLACPIDTILQSLQDNEGEGTNIHDLIEAYNTLYCRLRHHNFQSESLALEYLRTHGKDVIQCLRRDMRSGKTFRPRSEAFLDEESFINPILTEEDIENSRNSGMLCQHALRVASLFMALPYLFSVLPNKSPAKLFRHIVQMGQERLLPTWNAHITLALVFWCIQSQQLPLNVLLPRANDMVSSLEIAIIEEGCGEPAKLAAFKAVRHVLNRTPDLLQQFLKLLPPILNHLSSERMDYAIQAGYALSGFVTAKLALLGGPPAIHREISKIVHDFLEFHSSRQGAYSSISQLERLLPDIFPQSMKDEDTRGPFWTLSVLASFIVLADGTLFFRPKSLKLVIKALRHSSKHPNRSILFLHTEVWKSMIWCLSRVFEPAGWDGEKSLDKQRDKFDKAFQVLTQENGQGVGACLVAAVLCNHQAGNNDTKFVEQNVSKAVHIVKKLVQDATLVSEALQLLERLMSAIGSSAGTVAPLETSDFFPKFLVDGTLLTAGQQQLTHSRFTHIRPLTEAEINAHWNELVNAWAKVADASLSNLSPTTLGTLGDIWQALLLSQTQLTQGHHSLTSTTPLTSYITRFILPEPDVSLQESRLSLVKKLWKVLTNSFNDSWLPTQAEVVLASILNVQFDLLVDKVKKNWSELCASLIEVGATTLLGVLHSRTSESQEDEPAQLEVTRQLWMVLGRQQKRALDAEGHHWTGFVSFLTIPFRNSNATNPWLMNETEQEMWKAVFKVMIASGAKEGVATEHVLSHFLQHVPEAKQNLLFHAPHCLEFLLKCIMDLPTSSERPFLALKDFFNEVMSHLYDLGHESSTAIGLNIFSLLQGQLKYIAHDDLLPLVEAFQSSVAVWLEDPKDRIPLDTYTNLVGDIYSRVIETLATTEISLSTLERLQPFLVSVFGKDGGTNKGREAFYDFWKKACRNKAELEQECPLGILACLKACRDTFGDSLGDDISIGTLSPSTIISDSQSPVTKEMHRSTDTGFSQFSDLGALVGYGYQLTASSSRNLSRKHSKNMERTPSQSRSTTPKGSEPQGRPQALRDILDYESTGDVNLGTGSMGSLGALSKRLFDETGNEDRDESGLMSPKFDEDAGSEPPRKRRRASGDLDRNFGTFSQAIASPLPASSPPLEDDYDSWEAGISMEDLRAIQEGLQDVRSSSIGGDEKSAMENTKKPQKHDSDDDVYSLNAHAAADGDKHLKTQEQDPFSKESVSNHSQYRTTRHLSFSGRMNRGTAHDRTSRRRPASQVVINVEDAPILDPTITSSGFPLRSRLRDRSRTAPPLDVRVRSPSPDSAPTPAEGKIRTSVPHAQPLRRHYTSSAQLDALRDAYVSVAEAEGVSQIPVEDLMQARRLANQISQALDEQMYRKLGKQG